jgi:nitrate reductase NapAB chaperone NapD
MNVHFRFTERAISKPLTIIVVVVFLTIAVSQGIPVSSYAETGKGSDIFRVIMTVFGVEDTKGDIVVIVTANDGESSKVKFLETEAFKPVSSNLTSLVLTPNPGSNAGIMEYVATFPNVTVNAGDEYKACVMTTKELELLCKTGHNSPASRPEFIDINLDEVNARQTETEEQ